MLSGLMPVQAEGNEPTSESGDSRTIVVAISLYLKTFLGALVSYRELSWDQSMAETGCDAKCALAKGVTKCWGGIGWSYGEFCGSTTQYLGQSISDRTDTALLSHRRAEQGDLAQPRGAISCLLHLYFNNPNSFYKHPFRIPLSQCPPSLLERPTRSKMPSKPSLLIYSAGVP